MKAGRWLSILALSLAAGAGAARADLTTGLIAHYELNGNALDSSPNGNNGTISGPLVATTDRHGTAGAAYEFNGTNSFITVPNSASLSSPTNAITMSAWIMMYGNSKVGSPFGPVLMKSVSGSNAFMYRLLANPSYFGACYNDWNLHQSAGATIPINTWHHIASTFNGTKHRFYFDGAFVQEWPLALTITTDTRPLTIGADYPGFFECFWGKLDDVRIYNRTLNDTEVGLLYTGTVGVEDGVASASFAIRRTFPSPAPGGVTLEFALAESAPVDLVVLDVLGRRIRALSLGLRAAGTQSIVWDGRADSGNLAGAGVYFVRLITPHAAAEARVVRIE
jgi:hypothetical protein